MNKLINFHKNKIQKLLLGNGETRILAGSSLSMTSKFSVTVVTKFLSDVFILDSVFKVKLCGFVPFFTLCILQLGISFTDCTPYHAPTN